MATILTYNPYSTIISVFANAAMASLADGAFTAASSAIGADATGGPLLGDFILTLGSINPTDNKNLAELYALRAPDGTNFEDAPSATNPGSGMYLGAFVGDYGSSAKLQVLPGVTLPNGLWKGVLKNVCGVTWNASNNSLQLRPYNLLST